MKTIKGFEDEDIVVSDFGEWVGKNYIDYKSEYENNQKIIKDLFAKNDYLQEKLDKYENPDDMTLMYMWCTEKVKDDNKKLQERVEYLERSNNRREDAILEQRQEIELLEHYKTLYQFLKKEKEEFRKCLKKMLDDENDIFSVVRVKDVLSKLGEYQ